MAQVQGEELYLAHSGQEVDDNIEEVQTARGGTASLSAALAAKQDALTFDTVPTANSTNPVTSGGVQAPLAAVIDAGAKNLLNNSEAYSQTVGDVTFTLNADGSITANGTKTNNNWFILSTGNSLKAGTYVLSDGLPVDTLNCQLFISTTNSFSTAIMSTGANARPYTKTLTQDYSGLYYAIRIASGTVCNNLTFKPMLCKKTDWDISQAYQPYAPTNRELYEMILALQSGTRRLQSVSLPQSDELRTEPDEEQDDEEMR